MLIATSIWNPYITTKKSRRYFKRRLTNKLKELLSSYYNKADICPYGNYKLNFIKTN